MMSIDIFDLGKDIFVLWRASSSSPPALVGQLQPGAPVGLGGEQQFSLTRSPEFSDVWTIPAVDCNLTDGEVYYYWFEVTDTHPERTGQRIRITDPLPYVVDWRLRAPRPAGPAYPRDDSYSAAVVTFEGGSLVPCDVGGEIGQLADPAPSALPPNSRSVTYELPTAWTRVGSDGGRERAVGTFRDVRALIDHDDPGVDFAGKVVTAHGRSYLGFPSDSSHPTPNRDLRDLVAAGMSARMGMVASRVRLCRLGERGNS